MHFIWWCLKSHFDNHLSTVRIDFEYSCFSICVLYIFSSSCAAPCPTGWVTDPNKTKCFLHVGRPQSWNDSETCCNKYGGHLASLTSLQELHFAQSLCGESINSCWIGGRRLNSTSGFQWIWSDNSQWNKSIFPLADVPLNCNGTKLSCLRNSTNNLCTVLTNISESLMIERCDNPHASLCILDIGTFLMYILPADSHLRFIRK